MANEIYNSTWWGNTIDTASSIGTSTDMIQGQFNLTKLGDELVVNGDFATDTDWVKETGWSISNGKANANVSGTNAIFQTGIEINKNYKVTYTISNYISGDIRIRVGTSSIPTVRSSNGTFTENLYATGTNQVRISPFTGGFIGSIDNVSVKEVRATSVEASKCLADAIHRIGIQNIQN